MPEAGCSKYMICHPAFWETIAILPWVDKGDFKAGFQSVFQLALH